MKHRKFSLIFILFVSVLVMGIVVAFAFNYFWASSIKSGYIKNTKIMKNYYLKEKKIHIQSDVLKIVESISYRNVIGEYKIKGIVQSSLNNIIFVVRNIYSKYKDIYGENYIKDILRDFFEKSSFYFKKGFYVLVSKNGVALNDSKTKFSKKTKEEFSYFFSNFNYGFFYGKTIDGKSFISYVKLFKPLNVYIVSCMYSNALENEIKNEIIYSIIRENSVVNKNRSVFVITKDGRSVITNNKIFNDGAKIWETYKSTKNKKFIKDVFNKELLAYKHFGGKFVHYSWHDPKTGKITEKILFIRGYKPWGWIIGEGFYVDEAVRTIQSIKEQMYGTVDKIFAKSYIFTFITIGILLLFMYFLFLFASKKIKFIFERFENYFHNRKKIDKDICRISELERVIDYINNAIDTFNRYENEFLEAFSYAMEVRDTYTEGHSYRVGRYAKMIAETLGFDDKKQAELYRAGLLHDIGKIGIPDTILLKPGKLTPNEHRIVRYHSVFSYEIVNRISQFEYMSNYIRHHHERCDGKGYPDGLKCDEIEIEAKILAIADVFDALTSRRSYRDELTPQEAVEVLKKEQLDQKIIKRVQDSLIDGYVAETDVEVRMLISKEIDEIRKELFDIDYMTGLKRRKVFINETRKFIKKSQPFVLFMVDIKALSFINYEFSTKAGDRVIIRTAVALSELLEEMDYANNNLARAYNDAFLFTIKIKGEEDLKKLGKISEDIRGSLVEKVKNMFAENDKGKYMDKRNESIERFIDFHVLYCTYPYEAADAEKMIYVCVSKKNFTLTRLNNIDNTGKNSNIYL